RIKNYHPIWYVKIIKLFNLKKNLIQLNIISIRVNTDIIIIIIIIIVRGSPEAKSNFWVLWEMRIRYVQLSPQMGQRGLWNHRLYV
ncbi:MAG: hypothetical protein N7Q72_02255, partial [Spiroplasma sp. Tabriz.8]|nr:hypothetical protein [Spiroplasma sp. Tabriz.8]